MGNKLETLLERMNTYMVPPGVGVHTVHTAKEKKEGLEKQLKKIFSDVSRKTLLENKFKNKKKTDSEIYLLGIPSDSGGGILRGANWGPLFLREELIKKAQLGSVTYPFDLGDVWVNPHLLWDEYLSSTTIKNCQLAMYQGKSLPVSPLSICFDFLQHFYECFPHSKILSMGGDHSVSYPTVRQYLERKKNEGIRVGVLHFDAHTDLLEQRLGISYCFASWAYHMLQYLQNPKDFIQIGIRSTGKTKDHWEKTLGVKQYWAYEFIHSCEETSMQIIQHLKDNGIQEIYLSFDIDVLDKQLVSKTGTPEENGLNMDHIKTIFFHLQKSGIKVTGADIVELAPFIQAINSNDKTLEVCGEIMEMLLQLLNL